MQRESARRNSYQESQSSQEQAAPQQRSIMGRQMQRESAHRDRYQESQTSQEHTAVPQQRGTFSRQAASPRMQSESSRRDRYQESDELSDEDQDAMHKRGKVEKNKMSSMAPNFRVVKYINDGIVSMGLGDALAKVGDRLGTTTGRGTIMRFIATERKRDDRFNLAVQMVTKLDKELADREKAKGKTNEEISLILKKHTELQNLVRNLVKEIGKRL